MPTFYNQNVMIREGGHSNGCHCADIFCGTFEGCFLSASQETIYHMSCLQIQSILQANPLDYTRSSFDFMQSEHDLKVATILLQRILDLGNLDDSISTINVYGGENMITIVDFHNSKRRIVYEFRLPPVLAEVADRILDAAFRDGFWGDYTRPEECTKTFSCSLMRICSSLY